MSELAKIIDIVGKDKGIDKTLIISALEEAMLTVAKKKYGLTRDIEAKYNEDTSEVELYQFKEVVEEVKNEKKQILLNEAVEHDPDVEIGDSIGLKMDTQMLTRIAAQTAKQVIVQKVRDAEREIIYAEFQHRKGEVITGVIRRIDRGAVIVDLGRTEGYMPIKEQIPDEPYNPGDRIHAFLRDVQLTPKGPRIILSRACPEYLVSLFQTEVPEIREGLVTIVKAARDPGSRAKIAVMTRDPDVDAIGACVGVRGSRVQNIVQELKGERIDIVPWDEDISRFVCNALSPSEIQKVIIDEDEKMIDVVVSEDQLSIAIGRRGQNVRLATDLTGWELNIVSELEVVKKIRRAKEQLCRLPNITETLSMALYQSGFEGIRDVADADPSVFTEVPGFDQEKGMHLIKIAKHLVATGEVDEIEAKQNAEEEENVRAMSNKSIQDNAELKLAAEIEKTEKSNELGMIQDRLKAEFAKEQANTADNVESGSSESQDS